MSTFFSVGARFASLLVLHVAFLGHLGAGEPAGLRAALASTVALPEAAPIDLDAA